MSTKHKLSSKNRTRLILLVAVVVTVIALYIYYDVSQLLQEALEYVEELGWVGVGLFVGVYVLGCVLLLPLSLFIISAGVVFGFLNGLIIASLSTALGVTAAFLVGRYLARDRVRRIVSSNSKFNILDESVEQDGWLIMLLTRLSLVFPWNFLNYFFSITGVKFTHFVTASWLGMMPAIIMYVYIGSVGSELADLNNNLAGESFSTLRLIIYGISASATILVLLYIRRITRKLLQHNTTGKR